MVEPQQYDASEGKSTSGASSSRTKDIELQQFDAKSWAAASVGWRAVGYDAA